MNHLRARIYLSGLFLVMLAGLIYGFAWGDFWEDGGELMDNPWGIVSLVDVYVGFFLFLGWVWMGGSSPCQIALGSGDSGGRKSLCLPLCPVCPWAEPGKARSILLGKQGAESLGWKFQIMIK